MFRSFCAIFHDDFKYINGKSSRQETYVPLSANKTSRNGYKPSFLKQFLHYSWYMDLIKKVQLDNWTKNIEQVTGYRSRARTITTLQFLAETIEDLKQL